MTAQMNPGSAVLVTGAAGFIGANVVPVLSEKYRVTAPSRADLNLLNAADVRSFLSNDRFDAVVHLANPTGQNPVDERERLFELSLRVFTSLAHCSKLYGKMIYLGSGAEYGKHRDICAIGEESFGGALPNDGYGLSRYIMSEILTRRDNIVNLRLFACCGPKDPPYKLIPHILGCIGKGVPIALREDALFDFLYVDDIAPVISHFIDNDAKHKAYNLCSGERLYVSQIAEEVKRQTGSDLPVTFEKKALGFEYTGNNARLRTELPFWRPTPMREAIRRILEYEDRKA